MYIYILYNAAGRIHYAYATYILVYKTHRYRTKQKPTLKLNLKTFLHPLAYVCSICDAYMKYSIYAMLYKHNAKTHRMFIYVATTYSLG